MYFIDLFAKKDSFLQPKCPTFSVVKIITREKKYPSDIAAGIS